MSGSDIIRPHPKGSNARILFSSVFGGKGKVLNFYETGEELFRVMEETESTLNVQSFSIMDENFLLQKKRAMELLARMKEKRKSWAISVLSSANAMRKYSFQELVELGISSITAGRSPVRKSGP